MNAPTVLRPAVPVTLKDVVDRLASSPGLSDTRRRDLRSAVVIYGKLKGQPLSAIQLDLAAICHTLDGIASAQAKVSRKRWANLRSDLTAAMEASGLQPMLRTADVELEFQLGRATARRSGQGCQLWSFPACPLVNCSPDQPGGG